MKHILDLYNNRFHRLDGALATPEGVIDTARRSLLVKSATMGAASLGTAGALLAPTGANAQTMTTVPTDADVLTFALNLEYLEAEFYLLAATGTGLPADLTTGSGNANNAGSNTTGTSNGNNPGTVTGGRQVTFQSAVARQYANEIAADERAHVAYLRSALAAAGAPVIARPNLNLSTSFTALFQAAGIIGANDTFDPYANENNFLLAAYVFEDVGVTAYKGSSALITNKTYLTAAAGILAIEAYHAGLIRTVLYTRGANMSGTGTAATNGSGSSDGSGVNSGSSNGTGTGGTTVTGAVSGGGTSIGLRVATDRIAAARASVDGSTRSTTTTTNGTTTTTAGTADDQGVSIGQDPNTPDTDTANVTPFDANAIAFSRTPGQVLNVVYLNTPPSGSTAQASSMGGGFLPNGANGNVRASTANS